MQIWDTAGQERFREPALQYYQGAVGIALVYDVTDAKSYEHIEYWVQRVRQHCSADAEIIIIGNKIDMINDIVVN